MCRFLTSTRSRGAAAQSEGEERHVCTHTPRLRGGFGTDAATQARLEQVLAFLRDTGYRNIELFTLSGLSATQMRALLDEYGIKASARHVDVGTPTAPANLDRILAENKILGIKYFGSGANAELRHRGPVGGLRRVLGRAGRARPQGRPDADGPQPQLGVRAPVRRRLGVRDAACAHRPAQRRLPARPVLVHARPRDRGGRDERRAGG